MFLSFSWFGQEYGLVLFDLHHLPPRPKLEPFPRGWQELREYTRAQTKTLIASRPEPIESVTGVTVTRDKPVRRQKAARARKTVICPWCNENLLPDGKRSCSERCRQRKHRAEIKANKKTASKRKPS